MSRGRGSKVLGRGEDSGELASDLTGVLRADASRAAEEVPDPLSPRIRRERASVYPRVKGTFVRGRGSEGVADEKQGSSSVYPQISVPRGALKRPEAPEGERGLKTAESAKDNSEIESRTKSETAKVAKGASSERKHVRGAKAPLEAPKINAVADTLVQTDAQGG